MFKKMSIVALMCVAAPAFANDEDSIRPNHRHHPGIVAVSGDVAQAIWDALNVPVETKQTDRGTIELKSAGTLRCGKMTKADGAQMVDIYRCGMMGKKVRPHRGPKPDPRNPAPTPAPAPGDDADSIDLNFEI